MSKHNVPVLLVKLTDLAGRTVLLRPVVGNSRPFWYQVDRVEGPSNPANVGRRVYVYGRRVRATGKPSTATPIPVDFIGPRHVLAVR